MPQAIAINSDDCLVLSPVSLASPNEAGSSSKGSNGTGGRDTRSASTLCRVEPFESLGISSTSTRNPLDASLRPSASSSARLQEQQRLEQERGEQRRLANSMVHSLRQANALGDTGGDTDTTTPLALRGYLWLSGFFAKVFASESDLQIRQSKIVAGVALTVGSIICALLLVALGVNGHHNYLIYVTLWYGIMLGTWLCALLHLLITKRGLRAARLCIVFFLEVSPLPLFFANALQHAVSPAPLIHLFHVHTVTLFLYSLMGGDVSGIGGVLLTLFHVMFSVILFTYDQANEQCTWLSAHGDEHVHCGLVTFGPLAIIALLDLVGHSCLVALLQRLDHERMVADALVDNCLPRAISSDIRVQISTALTEASRQKSQTVVKAHLKQQPELIGFHVAPTVGVHENVTVMFADICGFTDASTTLQPSELVDVLRGVFQEIDHLCICSHVEKIKTIGDCYMACGNLNLGAAGGETGPMDALRGALCVVELGRAITCLTDFYLGSLEVRFRVGAHTGALTSGVIGLTKFSVDVWGDTVNIASRMESSGVRDRVQVSQQTYDLVRDCFLFLPRSVVIKGRVRPVNTYLLDDPTTASVRSSDDATDGTVGGGCGGLNPASTTSGSLRVLLPGENNLGLSRSSNKVENSSTDNVPVRFKESLAAPANAQGQQCETRSAGHSLNSYDSDPSKMSRAGSVASQMSAGPQTTTSQSSSQSGSPLVIGPSYFQRTDKFSRVSLVASQQPQTPKPTLGDRRKTQAKDAPEGGAAVQPPATLTEDLMMMITPKNMRECSPSASSPVSQWLGEQGLTCLADTFQKYEWHSLEDLALLTEGDLVSMGIEPEHRVVLLQEIDCLRPLRMAHESQHTSNTQVTLHTQWLLRSSRPTK